MSKTQVETIYIYIGVVSLVDYTKFNEDTADWSGETFSVDINETVKADSIKELHEKLANVCSATVSDFEEYTDKETNTFTQEECGMLADYYITIYKAEEIAL